MKQTVEYNGDATVAVDAVLLALVEPVSYGAGDWYVEADLFDTSTVVGYLHGAEPVDDGGDGVEFSILRCDPETKRPLTAVVETYRSTDVVRLVIP